VYRWRWRLRRLKFEKVASDLQIISVVNLFVSSPVEWEWCLNSIAQHETRAAEQDLPIVFVSSLTSSYNEVICKVNFDFRYMLSFIFKCLLEMKDGLWVDNQVVLKVYYNTLQLNRVYMMPICPSDCFIGLKL